MAGLFTAIGILGVVIVLCVYGMLTTGKLSENEPRYYWLNIFGTVCIGISLIAQWNLASMVSQVLWVVISLMGLARLKRRA